MKKTNIRIALIGLLALTALFLVVYNVFMVTVKGIHPNSGTDITAYTSSANVRTYNLESHRGYIYDRNGNIIALDTKKYSIYAVLSKDRPSSSSKPAYVDDIYKTALLLSPILGCEERVLIDYLSQDKYQVEFGPYGRNLSLETKELIESLDLNGIEFKEMKARSYPLGSFASHIIGFAQYDAEKEKLVGKMGIESIQNKQLTGKDGYKKLQVNTEGYTLPGSDEEIVEADNGNDIYLTIDKGIQEELEQSLATTIEQRNAEKAWGAVMEVETGKILAWGNNPTFDPNVLEIEDYTNLGTQYAYEPGSTMKTFTYAAAIDAGVYDGDKLFDSSKFLMGITDNKPVRLPEGTSRNVYGEITNSRNKVWGNISYDLGYRYSSNVGIASLLTTSLSISTFEEYLDRFHFFQKVGFEGFTEVTGTKNMRYPLEQLTAGFGQGMSITMIQLLQAYTAILNDGVMVKPYIIQQIEDPDTNEITYLADTDVVGQPIKESTAKKMQSLMWDVVNTSDGSGAHYQTSEVEVIGKTGTAQVAASSYKESAYEDMIVITSVVLAFPADDPKIMVYYAFLSPYASDLHTDTTCVTNVIKKAAINCGYTNPVKEEEEIPEEHIEEKEVEVYEMDNFINHTLDYVNKLKEKYECEVVILGNGSQIIDQYPDAGSIVTSKDRILLLTSKQDIPMIDLTGYTRKEVMALWKLCGLAVAIEGDGTVVSQSIAKGTLIYTNSLLEVRMEEEE